MKNFIFDLYGTLVDISTDETDSRFRSAIEGVFSEFGVKLTEKKIFDLYYDGINKRIKEKYSEPDLKAVFCDIFLAGGVTPGESTIRSAASSFRQLSTKRMKLFPFALDTLNSLKQKSARIYLLSNAQALFTRPELRLLNLEQLFDDVLLSSEFGFKKPDERIFKYFLEKNSLSPDETIYVGNDKYTDIIGASNAGLKTAYIRTEQSPPDDGIVDTPYAVFDGDHEKLKDILLSLCDDRF